MAQLVLVYYIVVLQKDEAEELNESYSTLLVSRWLILSFICGTIWSLQII